MEDQQNLEAIMGLIMFGGNAKSDAMEAIAAAKIGDFELADRKIADAEESLIQAHHAQTDMLTQAQRKSYASDIIDCSQSRSLNDIYCVY